MNRMKLFLLFTLFFGCGDSNKPEEKVEPLVINTTQLDFDEKAGEKNIIVSSSTEWTTSCSHSWLKTNPVSSSGGERRLTVLAEANSETNVRTGTVTVSSGAASKTVTVTQQAGTGTTADVAIDPQQTNISGNAGDVTVNVTSSIVWKVSIPGADKWVKVKGQTDSRVIFGVEENLSGEKRTSNIEFQKQDGSVATVFALTQEKGEYTLMTVMNPEEAQAGLSYNPLNTFMKEYGFDYTEHPYCNGLGGHQDGVHLAVEWDEDLKQYVFRFDIHITPVIDGDRCGSATDRQRNEMKSVTNNTTWAKVQGNWDEWQRLEWKMKIPKGYQPTTSFCHLHQIKAQDGPNNGNPLITITPRANSDGSNRRVRVEHTSQGGTGTSLGSMGEAPMTDFEDEWVQIVEEIHYRHDGFYSIKITRIRDGKELISTSRNNIDMWRSGSSYLRNKYGIYRSLAGGDLTENPAGQSPLLKNESVWLCDFRICEKNTNPNPTQTH
ncbi:MAG: BACON domain-containing protein [Tannerella sp.]|nr:BACON domain-containing protein [Tannerella sp.]